MRALIVQNGNAYQEGHRASSGRRSRPTGRIRPASPARGWPRLSSSRRRGGSTLAGVRRPERISPDIWLVDQALLDRPGNKEIQLQLFYDYRNNPTRYPEWQAYFRRHQPPTLIVWGRNDPIFPAEGAHPYTRDLKDVELHLLDTGHFALEEEGDTIATLMRSFLERKVGGSRPR